MEIKQLESSLKEFYGKLKANKSSLHPIDVLIPISVAYILLPNNPIPSNTFAVTWTIWQLIFSPKKLRWAMWPIATVLLVSVRTWWLNEPPGLVSGADGLMIVASMLAAVNINQKRWYFILISCLAALPLAALQLSPKPWTPNPFVGVNPGGYLLGLLLVIAIAWYSKPGKSLISVIASIMASALALLLVWQTGSRAALVSSFLALAIVFLRERMQDKSVWREISLLTIFTALCLGLKQLISPSSSGVPGLNISSDLGRILIGKCYLNLPLTGNNRLLYGVGFERPKEFCQEIINGGIADHSHNLYLQIWANSGILGLLGVALLAILLIQAWLKVGSDLDVFTRRAGKVALLYLIFQGFFDLSLLHLPIIQVFTGITLSAPIRKMSLNSA